METSQHSERYATIFPQPSARTTPGIARQETGTDNRGMAQNEWQRRIARAEELGAQYSFATEILRFYVALARFQEKFYEELGRLTDRGVASDSEPFERPLPPELTGRFGT